MKRKYQILRRRNSGYWSEAAGSVSLQVSLADLATAAREGMHDLMERLGLELMARTIEQERAALTEGPERVGYKWGSQPGFTFMNGRKVPLAHPRVRTLNGRREVPLRSYAKFQEDAGGRVAFRDLMRGVSTRNYAEGVEGFLQGYGVEKSSVSRQFVRASEEKLRELMERDLSKLDMAVVFIDGIGFADHLLIVALGVDRAGKKHTLGLWQGVTEKAEICQELLKDLERRGLDATKGLLFVIDGGKGLRAAIQRSYGRTAAVQRCLEHKKRNVLDHLPQHRQAEFRRKLSAAYAMLDHDEAKRALLACVADLERINPSAAASLREGLDETLTLHRLNVPAALRVSLSTTNPIESPFAFAREKTHRVKRWRAGDQVQRWTASALLAAEKSWRRVKGHKLMPELIEALSRMEI